MSMSITKLTQQLRSTTGELMQARANNDVDSIEELEAELEEIETAIEALEEDLAEDHRYGRF